MYHYGIVSIDTSFKVILGNKEIQPFKWINATFEYVWITL